MGPPAVSVVIPARDEARAIASCIASVQAQDVGDLEIVVVDGGSTDGTLAIVDRIAGDDPRVRIVHNPAGTIPVALNLGLAAARGRWFVRVDAHSTVTPEHVRVLTEHLDSGRWGGVGGRKDAVASTPMGAAIALALGSPAGVGDSAYHWAVSPRRTDHVPFGAYPVPLLRALGGWDERLEANEDYELDLRLRRRGHELLLDPSVRIGWRTKETLRDLFVQYRRYGRGKADVARLHPGSLAARHLAAPALVTALAAAVLVAPIQPWVAGAIVAPYVGFVIVASARIARRAGQPAAAPRVAAALTTMHVAWGLGFWQGRLRPPARLSRAAPPSAAAVRSRQSSAGPVT